MDGGAWWAAVHGVTKSQTRLSHFTFTFHFQALEKEMATHSSVLALRIPGTGEPGGLPSMGSYRVGHDWSNLAAAAAAGGTLKTNQFTQIKSFQILINMAKRILHRAYCNRTKKKMKILGLKQGTLLLTQGPLIASETPSRTLGLWGIKHNTIEKIDF